MNISLLADASLPGLIEAFPPPFVVHTYHSNKEIPALLTGQDILLCRSTLKVNQDLLHDHRLQIVATASSGNDHIDHTFLAKRGVTLFDAKGCNANAVADYVVASIAYLKTTLNFDGALAGVIGAGAVGSQVISRLRAIGFEVISHDPPKAALDRLYDSTPLEALLNCDLICIHANRHAIPPYPSINLLDANFLSRLRPNTVILNAARGGIVSEEALLNFGKSLIYCTDVYQNEPDINPQILRKATLSTPHIAGHSIEAKKRAVTLLSEKLHHYYQLPTPVFVLPPKLPLPPIKKEQSWEETVLSLYNPIHETNQFKQNTQDKLNQTFLNIRQAHCRRHNFNCYEFPKANNQLESVFGISNT